MTPEIPHETLSIEMNSRRDGLGMGGPGTDRHRARSVSKLTMDAPSARATLESRVAGEHARWFLRGLELMTVDLQLLPGGALSRRDSTWVPAETTIDAWHR